MGACDTGTCFVCKNETGCNWYGFDCFSTTDTKVTSLNIPATATCDVCQAGNCGDCQEQEGCTWFSSVVPGVPGKCDMNTSSPTGYNVVDTCPTCHTFDAQGCDVCNAQNASGCGWYTLPGGVGGKCREAAPSFAYSKVPAGSCSTGNLCSGMNTCSDCKDVVNPVTNDTACNWYISKSPSFYNSKCDDKTAGIVSNALYDASPAVCPLCAGNTCVDCKAENGCKWYTLQGVGGFGECKVGTASVPTGKSEVSVCPAECDVHSCVACRSNTACSWYTGSSVIDDSCDLASDANFHPVQTAATSCGACAADRCFECNNLAGCGWYAEKVGPITVREGCFATASAPSGRVLVSNSDSKCDGATSGSAGVAISAGLLVALALFA